MTIHTPGSPLPTTCVSEQEPGGRRPTPGHQDVVVLVGDHQGLLAHYKESK